jgi:uncharacterized membrane protein YkoI
MRALAKWLIVWCALTLGACADDHGKSYWLRHASLTLPEAANIAERNASGRAVRVELKQSGTRVFYEVEVVDTLNKVRIIRVDAESGKIITGLSLP